MYTTPALLLLLLFCHIIYHRVAHLLEIIHGLIVRAFLWEYRRGDSGRGGCGRNVCVNDLSMMCYYYADLVREARGGVYHGGG